MTNKFENGKIYQLVNDVNDIVYIGSTTKHYLCDRMNGHRYDSKTRSSAINTAMRDIGVEHFKIKLIKHFPCSSLSELQAEECAVMQEYKKNEIDLYNTIVIRSEFRSYFTRGSIGKYGGKWKFQWYQGGVHMSKSFSVKKWGGEWSAKRMAELWQRLTYPE